MKFLCIYMMIYIRKVVGYPVAVDKEASRGRKGEKGKRASIQVTPREMRGMMMGNGRMTVMTALEEGVMRRMTRCPLWSAGQARRPRLGSPTTACPAP